MAKLLTGGPSQMKIGQILLFNTEDLGGPILFPAIGLAQNPQIKQLRGLFMANMAKSTISSITSANEFAPVLAHFKTLSQIKSLVN